MEPIFKARDRVFARYSMYAPWPAMVIRPTSSRRGVYKVKFYGTGEEAAVSARHLCSYDPENAQRFKNPSSRTLYGYTRTVFDQAFAEIEQGLDIIDESEVVKDRPDLPPAERAVKREHVPQVDQMRSPPALIPMPFHQPAGVVTTSSRAEVQHTQPSLTNEVLESLEDLRDVFADLVIVSSDGERFACNKNVVAGKSNPLTEYLRSPSMGELRMAVSRDGVEAFLDFQYRRNLDKASNSCQVTLELLQIASQYEIHSLKESVVEIILRSGPGWFEGPPALKLVTELVPSAQTEPKVEEALRKLFGVLNTIF